MNLSATEGLVQHRFYAIAGFGLNLKFFCVFGVIAKPKVSASLLRNRRKAWERWQTYLNDRNQNKKQKQKQKIYEKTIYCYFTIFARKLWSKYQIEFHRKTKTFDY
jgi:hypothetical protein